MCVRLRLTLTTSPPRLFVGKPTWASQRGQAYVRIITFSTYLSTSTQNLWGPLQRFALATQAPPMFDFSQADVSLCMPLII